MYLFTQDQLDIDLPDGTPVFVFPTRTSKNYAVGECNGSPEAVAWLLSKLPAGKVFVDAHANVGTFSLPIAADPNCAGVVALEPDHRFYRALRLAAILSEMDSKVTVYHKAPGSAAQVGTRQLRAFDEYDCRATILDAVVTGIGRTPKSTEAVDVITLDSLNLTNVGLIRLDCDGNELNVLKGAATTLINSGKPRIVLEAWSATWYASARVAIRNYLQGLGYTITPVPNTSEWYLAEA